MNPKTFKRVACKDPGYYQANYYVRFMVAGRRYCWCTKTNDASLARKRGKDYKEAIIAKQYHLVDAMTARGLGQRISQLFEAYLALPQPPERTRKRNVAAAKAIMRGSKLNDADSISRLNARAFVSYQTSVMAKPGANAVTCNSVVRKARSLFSRRARAYYKASGLDIKREHIFDVMEVPLLPEPEKRPQLPDHAADSRAHVELTGASRRAYLLARYAGLRARRIKMILFLGVGLTSAVAGLMTASRLGSVRYDLAAGGELQMVLMAMLGGTYIFGGRGTILGTFLAAWLLVIVTSGMIVANWLPAYQLCVLGILLIVSIIATNFIYSRTER